MIPQLRLEIGRGDGAVAALDGVAVFVPAGYPAEALLERARAAAEAGAAPGRALARKLAGLLTGDEADAVPPFGILADTGDGLLVFLHGAVEATVVEPDGSTQRLSGADAATWLDRVLPVGNTEVLVMPVGAQPDPAGGPFELGSGVVPGGWMRAVPVDRASDAPAPTGAEQAPAPAASPELDAAPEVVAAPEVEAAPEPVAPPEAEPLAAEEPAPSSPPPAPPAPAPAAPAPAAVEPETTPIEPPPIPPPPSPSPAPPVPDPDPEPPTEEFSTSFESIALTPDRASLREPLPLDAPEAGSTPPEEAVESIPDRKIVAGIMCSRQHFNSPDSHYCSTCGISMVHATHNLIHRERPPLGFLVFDDGSTFTLDDRYILGREPETDPAVQAGEARAIVLEDPQMSVSRVHAEITLVGWDVQLIDRGSTNGTHVLNAQGTGWDRLPADHPYLVAPGTRGAVGQRTFVYETPQRNV